MPRMTLCPKSPLQTRAGVVQSSWCCFQKFRCRFWWRFPHAPGLLVVTCWGFCQSPVPTRKQRRLSSNLLLGARDW
ncbi:hypothetical protein CLIM01_14632 [Colletotrichum limetticola]|uniref:Uncharacterized protein n=1 Tax=Colletotrichum limetticola TaxID=1209924 RepID=A0ABQ9PDP0_9PEZI|nr:hypothetical protein CLIM01_14632 [Colletotrichum limetticola]